MTHIKKTLFLICLIAAAIACKSTPENKAAKEGEAKAEAEAPKTEVEATLTDAEKAAGFKLLFNGKNTEGWHPFRGVKDTNYKWSISEGVLASKGGHVDLVTDGEYESFDLTFEWKVDAGGNSGIIYMVQEGDTTIHNTWQTGVEYQLIDDKGWPGGLQPKQHSGVVYDLYDPKVMASNDAGQWNKGRILNEKGHIQHFLNDKLVGEYVWDSPDFKARVAKSKFKDYPFAKKMKGHIAIQDHGQDVAVRNVKIKEL